MKTIQLQATFVAVYFNPTSIEALLRRGFTVDIMRDDLDIESYFQPLQETTNRSIVKLPHIHEVLVNVFANGFQFPPFFDMVENETVRGVRLRLEKEVVNPNETYPVEIPSLFLIDCT
jgi:hypothetical protein